MRLPRRLRQRRHLPDPPEDFSRAARAMVMCTGAHASNLTSCQEFRGQKSPLALKPDHSLLKVLGFVSIADPMPGFNEPSRQ